MDSIGHVSKTRGWPAYTVLDDTISWRGGRPHAIGINPSRVVESGSDMHRTRIDDGVAGLPSGATIESPRTAQPAVFPKTKREIRG